MDQTTDHRFIFLLYGQQTYCLSYDSIHMQETLWVYKLLNQMQSVNRKVPNGII